MPYYFVHEGLAWPPPTMHGRCAEPMPPAAERAETLRSTVTGVYPMSAFAGKYWYAAVEQGAMANWPLPIPDEWAPANQVEQFCQLPLSTDEIGLILDRGFEVTCIEGPFDTRGEAQYCLDLHWER